MKDYNNAKIKRGTTFVKDLSHKANQYLGAKEPFNTKDTILQIIPLGGSEEIGGRNMTVIEYGKDIIVIDIGMKFPEEDQPGIDYIIPNPSYLKGKEDRIRAVLITHGHMDHIGGVSQVMSMIGNPPIYAPALPLAMMKRRQGEFTTLPPLNGHVAKLNEKLRLGVFTVTFLHINHSIPDSTMIKIETPEGVILHTGDFKIDATPVGEAPADLEMYKKIGDEGVLLLLSDSTSASRPGKLVSEMTIQNNIDHIFENATGKIIVTTFSSTLNRIQQMINLSEKYNRKVVIEGFSMKTNIQILHEIGYAKFSPQTLITAQEARNIPPENLTIICTGAQGDERSALTRMANKEHRNFQIEPGDTVVFSSSVVPGNEESVQKIKDAIAKQRANIIHYKMMEVHVSGHAQKDDLKHLLEIIRPKYLQPIYGDFYALKSHSDLAQEVGMKKDNILLTDNGRVIQVYKGEARVTTEKVNASNMMVDGLGVGDLKEIVIRDRQSLSQDGILTIVILLDLQQGKIIRDPEIVSKGFVHIQTSTKLLSSIKERVKDYIEQKLAKEGQDQSIEDIQKSIREDLGLFLFKTTQRRPMIIPVVIEI
ncbi:MAG: ribonuclease J [Minisyncoccia bacterium]